VITTEKKLTPKEIRFCEEYFKSGRARESAVAAGYSEKSAATIASRLIKSEKIRNRISELETEKRAEREVDSNWLVQKAVDVYNRCMQAEPVTTWDSSERCRKETGEYTFDSKDALKALELIKSILVPQSSDDDNLSADITFVDDVAP